MKINQLKFLIDDKQPFGVIAEVGAKILEFCAKKQGCAVIKYEHIFEKGCCVLLYECVGVTQEELFAVVNAPAPVPLLATPQPAASAPLGEPSLSAEATPVPYKEAALTSEPKPPSEAYPGSFLLVGPGFSLTNRSESDLGDALRLTEKICEIGVGEFRYIVRDASSITGEAPRPCLEIIRLLEIVGGDFSPSAVRGAVLICSVEDRGEKTKTYLLDCFEAAISSLVQCNRSELTVVRTEIENEELYRQYMTRLWAIEPNFRQYFRKQELNQIKAKAKGVWMSCVFEKEFIEELRDAGFELEFEFLIKFQKLLTKIFEMLSTKTRQECLKFWQMVSCRTEDAIRETFENWRGLKEAIRGALILLEAVGYNPLFVSQLYKDK